MRNVRGERANTQQYASQLSPFTANVHHGPKAQADALGGFKDPISPSGPSRLTHVGAGHWEGAGSEAVRGRPPQNSCVPPGESIPVSGQWTALLHKIRLLEAPSTRSFCPRPSVVT